MRKLRPDLKGQHPEPDRVLRWTARHLNVQEHAAITVERGKGVRLQATGRALERDAWTVPRKIKRGLPGQ